jgi:xylan 1,4-beta-xylosidase
VIDFSPSDERQFAGLTAYYCRFNFFYLTISGTEDGERELLIMSSDVSWPLGTLTYPFQEPVKLPKEGKVKLALTIRGGKEGQFWYALEKERGWEDLKKVGKKWDASILSDECGGHQHHGSFTGAFVGVAASDLNGLEREANFDYFVYRPVEAEGDRYEI